MTDKPSKALITTSAPIISNMEVMPGAHLIRLESPPLAATARPGQFVMVRCGQDTYLRRPLSIHRVEENQIALLFTIAGRGTSWLAERKTGEALDIFGPLGNGFAVHPHSKNLLLIAGGIGIAPLRLLADAATAQGLKVTILLGATSAVHLLPIIPLPRAANARATLPFSINVVNATDDGSEGFKGLVTDLIPAYIDEGDQIFACGPLPMYKTMATLSQHHPKLKSAQVSLEIVMGCGIGVCYGCTIRIKGGLKQVCKDGPVFELGDITWKEIRGV